MSKENTRKFLDDVSSNETLKNTLLGSNAQAWIASAKTAGYEITAEELADELIGTIRSMATGELDEGSLDAVTGGAGTIAQRKMISPALKIQPVGNLRAVSPGLKVPGKAAARW